MAKFLTHLNLVDPVSDASFSTSRVLVADASGNLEAIAASGGGTTNFFRADGTWAAPTGGTGTILGSVLASAGVIAYGTGTLDTVTSSTDFTYDGTGLFLSHDGGGAAVGDMLTLTGTNQINTRTLNLGVENTQAYINASAGTLQARVAGATVASFSGSSGLSVHIAGSATVPTIHWTGDADTGFYYIGGGQFGVTHAGVASQLLNTTDTIFYEDDGTTVMAQLERDTGDSLFNQVGINGANPSATIPLSVNLLDNGTEWAYIGQIKIRNISANTVEFGGTAADGTFRYKAATNADNPIFYMYAYQHASIPASFNLNAGQAGIDVAPASSRVEAGDAWASSVGTANSSGAALFLEGGTASTGASTTEDGTGGHLYLSGGTGANAGADGSVFMTSFNALWDTTDFIFYEDDGTTVLAQFERDTSAIAFNGVTTITSGGSGLVVTNGTDRTMTFTQNGANPNISMVGGNSFDLFHPTRLRLGKDTTHVALTFEGSGASNSHVTILTGTETAVTSTATQESSRWLNIKAKTWNGTNSDSSFFSFRNVASVTVDLETEFQLSHNTGTTDYTAIPNGTQTTFLTMSQTGDTLLKAIPRTTAGQTNSPTIGLEASAYDTSEHPVEWQMYVDPLADTGASSNLVIQSRVDGGAWVTPFTMNADSDIVLRPNAIITITSGGLIQGTGNTLRYKANENWFTSGTSVDQYKITATDHIFYEDDGVTEIMRMERDTGVFQLNSEGNLAYEVNANQQHKFIVTSSQQFIIQHSAGNSTHSWGNNRYTTTPDNYTGTGTSRAIQMNLNTVAQAGGTFDAIYATLTESGYTGGEANFLKFDTDASTVFRVDTAGTITASAVPRTTDGQTNSPSMLLKASAYESVTEHPVEWQIYVDPLADTGASSNLLIQSRVDGGAWGTELTIESDGDLTMGGASPALRWAGGGSNNYFLTTGSTAYLQLGTLEIRGSAAERRLTFTGTDTTFYEDDGTTILAQFERDRTTGSGIFFPQTPTAGTTEDVLVYGVGGELKTVTQASLGGGVTASGTPLAGEVAVFTSGTDITGDNFFKWTLANGMIVATSTTGDNVKDTISAYAYNSTAVGGSGLANRFRMLVEGGTGTATDQFAIVATGQGGTSPSSVVSIQTGVSGTLTERLSIAIDGEITFNSNVGGGGTTNFLRADGTWAAAGGGGDVTASGTPLNGELAVWTSGTDIEGDSTLVYDGATHVLGVGQGVSTNTVGIELGDARTDSGVTHIDFVADSVTYTDYAHRIIRSAGANATLQYLHNGTGQWQFAAAHDSNIVFDTSAIRRMFIDGASGGINIGDATNAPASGINLQVTDATLPKLRLDNSDTTLSDGDAAAIEFYTHDASTGGTGIAAKIALSASNAGSHFDLTFDITDGGTYRDEAMRINYLGDILFGRTGVQSTSDMWFDQSTGDLHTEGDMVANSTSITSDIRLKSDINYLCPQEALNVIGALSPATFHKIGKEGLYGGFIAQEVEELLPHLISEKEVLGQKEGIMFKHLNEVGIIPYLVGASQAQYSIMMKIGEVVETNADKIKRLEKRIMKLENQIKQN